MSAPEKIDPVAQLDEVLAAHSAPGPSEQRRADSQGPSRCDCPPDEPIPNWHRLRA